MNSYLEPNISRDNVNGLPGEVQYVLLPVAGFFWFSASRAGGCRKRQDFEAKNGISK